MRRNAKAHSSSEGRFRVGRCLRAKIEIARRHFQRRSVNPASSSHAREFRVRGSFSVGESDWRKKRCQSTAVDRSRKDVFQEFRILGGCPRLENVSRSICSVRKSYPRGYFFAPDLNAKELVADPRAFRTRAPSRTHAFDDARRAHERVPHDFVRARIHPHVAGTRHRPIVGRPSVRVAGAFSRAPIHDAGARPDGPRDRPHARARARERQGDQPCGRRTDRAGTASSVLRGASGWREARANSRHRPKSWHYAASRFRRFSDCARANRRRASPTRLPRTDRRTDLSLRFLLLMIRLTSRFDPTPRETTKRSAEPRAFRLRTNPPAEVRSA